MSEADRRAPLARDAMAYVLAGGRGSRLMELTDRRAKPAVFFGGKTRIIDFALSNALNSGIRRIGVATQYKAHSLIRHLQRGWNFFRPERNESFDILPASQRVSETQWYIGTADAVFQNIDIIESYAPEHIIILAGDHIYKMDYELMLQQHVDQAADVTVGCLEVPRVEATGFGVMHVDAADRIITFLEKPKDPPAMPDNPDMALASMGIYVFDTKFLFELLRARRRRPDVEPRLRQGHHPGDRQERQGRRAPLHQVLRALEQRDRGLLARRRHGRRLLGGQYRPDRHHPGARPLRPRLADLDLCRDHPAGQVRPRRRRPPRLGRELAGLRRLHRLRRVAPPLAALHRRARQFLRRSRRRGRPALCRHRPLGAPQTVVIDRGVHIPEGLVVGEDPEEDARRFRRTEKGICLITQPMIDRLKN